MADTNVRTILGDLPAMEDVEGASADKRLGALEASHSTLVVDATLLLLGGW
jgi:hypothetical protein